MMIGLTHLLLLTLTHALELDMENTRADTPVSLSNAKNLGQFPRPGDNNDITMISITPAS
jgi:hypothetical protein